MTNKLPDLLTETIKEKNFQDVVADLGEIALDAVLNEGILRDIPLLGSFLGLSNATLSIQDKLFTKKILSFLLELKNTDVDSRRTQIEKIDRDPNYKTKVGEKLLYIIDKCEDSEKATYIGKLFRFYIEEKMTYEEFLRASKSVELTFLYDLKRFIKEKWDNMEMEEAGDLVSSGLMVAIYTPSDGLRPSELKVIVSSIGKLIQRFFDDQQ
jgi:hypothetical protein